MKEEEFVLGMDVMFWRPDRGDQPGGLRRGTVRVLVQQEAMIPSLHVVIESERKKFTVPQGNIIPFDEAVFKKLTELWNSHVHAREAFEEYAKKLHIYWSNEQ